MYYFASKPDETVTEYSVQNNQLTSTHLTLNSDGKRMQNKEGGSDILL